MKTYDEVYQNVIAATTAHKKKMRKIQNAVSVSAVRDSMELYHFPCVTGGADTVLSGGPADADPANRMGIASAGPAVCPDNRNGTHTQLLQRVHSGCGVHLAGFIDTDHVCIGYLLLSGRDPSERSVIHPEAESCIRNHWFISKWDIRNGSNGMDGALPDGHIFCHIAHGHSAFP